MKDVSTHKTKRSSNKEKKSVQDVCDARLQNIKKRLEFDKDLLLTPPKRSPQNGSHVSKFTAFGGSSRRECWDEAVIYGTEDEYLEEEERELKYIDQYQTQQQDLHQSESIIAAYYQGREEFGDALLHLVKPSSKGRKCISFRNSDKHSYVTGHRENDSSSTGDLYLDGSEFVDGIMSIEPDNLLASKSEELRSSRKSKSPEALCIPSEDNHHRKSISNSTPEKVIRKPSNIRSRKSDIFIQETKVASPSKLTQTDFTSFQDGHTSQVSIEPSNIEHGKVLPSIADISNDMDSFTQSLEELDEAIFLHSLARKYHIHKHRQSDHREPYQEISVKREFQHDSKVHGSMSQHSRQSRAKSKNINSNAFESRSNKDSQNSRKHSNSMDRGLEFANASLSGPEHRKPPSRHSTFLTESYHIDSRSRHKEIEEIRKRLFDADHIFEPLFPKKDKGTTDEMEMSFQAYEQILKSPVHTGTEAFLTSLDDQSRWRSSREKHRSVKDKLLELRNSQRSVSSKQNEETLFNVSTDFSDKRQKQSNLYLEESPRERSELNTGSVMLDLESSHVRKPRSTKRNFCDDDGFILDTAGPLSMEELETSEGNKLTVRARRKKILQESKKLRKDRVNNFIPKLELDKSPIEKQPLNFDTLQEAKSRSKKRNTSCRDEQVNLRHNYRQTGDSYRENRSRHLDEELDMEQEEVETGMYKRSLSRFDETKLLQDVRELSENLHNSGRSYNFDPEQALLDAASCTDLSMDLSRIENCSSIGPWEVDTMSPRDAEKLSVKRQHNIQNYSSPSKQSKPHNNVQKTSQHSVPSKFDKDTHPSEHSVKSTELSKRNTPHYKDYSKIGTDVNLVDLQEMHQDITNRLSHSDNIVHVLDCQDKHQIVGESEFKTQPNKYSGLDHSTDRNVIAKNPSKVMPQNEQKDMSHVGNNSVKFKKKKLTKPKPIHVHSLHIQQSKMNRKTDSCVTESLPNEYKQHATNILRNDNYNLSLVKFDRSDSVKLSNHLTKSSQNCPVSSTPLNSHENQKNKEDLSFEERGKKLDEICGLLSQSVKKRSRHSDCVKNLENRYNNIGSGNPSVSVKKRSNDVKKGNRTTKSTVDSANKTSVRHVDVQFDVRKKRKAQLKPEISNERIDCDPSRYQKELDSIENYYQQDNDAEDLLANSVGCDALKPKFDDMNFNSSPQLKILNKASSRFEIPKPDVVDQESDNDDEEISWLSKALHDKYVERHNHKDEETQFSNSSKYESSVDEEDVKSYVTESEEDIPLTMSDLYTPVTQLITNEFEDSSSNVSSKIGNVDSHLPLKTVFENLFNHRKMKGSELSEGSPEKCLISEIECDPDDKLTSIKAVNTKISQSPNGNNEVSQVMFPKSSHDAMEIPTRDFTASKNVSSKPFNSVDVILSHLDNEDSVRLLQRLYRADDKTRQQLIMKAEYFKRWQRKIKRDKHERMVYGPGKTRAREFRYSSLIQQYFFQWKSESRKAYCERKANELYRRHMLKKGFQGFKWAIYRSQHYHDIMKSRTHHIILSSLFLKWKKRTYLQQYNRMSLTFSYWHEFTDEQKRARIFSHQMKQKLVEKSFTVWIKRYKMKLKENIAEQFSRRSVLSTSIIVWKIFTNTSRIKQQRIHQAVLLYAQNLEKKFFIKMVDNYRKVQKAKECHRFHVLQQALALWKEGSKYSLQERQVAIQASEDHWEVNTTKAFFCQWREELWIKLAIRNNKVTTLRQIFVVWKTLCLSRKERQRKIISQLSYQKLSRNFAMWRHHVEVQKEKRVILTRRIEKIMLQVKLDKWQTYTSYKIDLRSKCKALHKKFNGNRLQGGFIIWLEKFLKQLSAQQARQYWSDTCVRKCVEKWNVNCKRTRLENLFIENEPDRDLNLVKVMFLKWQTAKWKIDQENIEADLIRQQLEKSKLRKKFQIWKAAMKQRMKIQPVIEAQHTKMLKQCFQSWHSIVQHKLKCFENHDLVVKRRLGAVFNSWRRQYDICLVEKQIQRDRMDKLSRQCLTEWRKVIKRKQAANTFHKEHIQSYLFTYWKSKTYRQICDKAEAIEEEEINLKLMKYYFNLWLENIERERMLEEDKIVMIHQQQSYCHLRSAFYTWKHQLHITLVARMYQRSLRLKHLKQVLIAWSDVTNYSLQDSVTQFSLRLGLPVRRASILSDLSTIGKCSIKSDDTFYMEDGDSTIPDSPRSNSSIISSSSINRLFSGYPGERSFNIDKLDLDSQSLLSGIESAIYNEREAKIQRQQEIVTVFITRLRNWPVSVVFDQWKGFIIRQRELRAAAAQLQVFSRTVKLKLGFKTWQKQFDGMKKAKLYREKVVYTNVMLSLQNYHHTRCIKKEMAATAFKHHLKTEVKKFLPIWIEKTKERQHKKSILQLWTTATPEEEKLLPLERNYTSKLNKRTMKLCFSIWMVKYQFVRRIQNAYHSWILLRTFNEWQQWTRVNLDRNKKCEEFHKKKTQLHVFKLWKLKLQLKQETQDRYNQAWKNYLRLIFLKWKQWAKENHNHQALSQEMIVRSQRNKLQQVFTYWKDLTTKANHVRNKHNRLSAIRVLHGWQDVIEIKRKEKKTILQFQVKSYTMLVKTLFNTWKERYLSRLNQQEEKEKYIQFRALEMGKQWRRKARKSRGDLFNKQLLQHKLNTYFYKWKSAYNRVLHLEELLEDHLEDKNQELIGRMVLQWKNRLLLNHVDQVYQTKLQITVFEEWKLWAKAKKERRIRGLALQRALQERNQHVYFKLWVAKTQVSQSVKKHFNIKLQIRTLQAWHIYTQKKKSLDSNYTYMAAKVRHNSLYRTFKLLRNRFDYCQGLDETSLRIQEDRNRAIQRHSLIHWHEKLDHIMSARCYGKFLAWRVARQWRNFVCRNKARRQKEADQEKMAVHHYNKHLCKMVFNVLKTERLVTMQREKHKSRLVTKYGRMWKWKVDLAFTAKYVDTERLIKRFWLIWRIEYSRKRATDKVQSFYQRQQLSQVFTAWRNLRYKQAQKSSIPVPVSSNGSSNGYNSGDVYDGLVVRNTVAFNMKSVTDKFPVSEQSKLLTNGIYKASNGLTKNNIRKIITRTRTDKSKSRIPSASLK